MAAKIVIALWIGSAVIWIGGIIAEKIMKKKNAKND